MLKTRYCEAGIGLTEISALLDGRLDEAAPAFLRLMNEYTGYPARAVFAPLAKSQFLDESSIWKLIFTADEATQIPLAPYQKNALFLSKREVEFALGISKSSRIFDAISEDRGKIIDGLHSTYDIDLFPIYDALKAEAPEDDSWQIYEPCFESERLDLVLSGKAQVTIYDPRKPISNLIVAFSRDHVLGMPLVEAADYLGVRKWSIMAAAKTGILNYRTSGLGNKRLYTIGQLLRYHNKYISHEELAESLTEAHVVAKALIASGIEPVASVMCNGRRRYIFERASLIILNDNALAELPGSPGVATSCPSSPSVALDLSAYCSHSEVKQELGMVTERLTGLEEIGLLKRAPLGTSWRTPYFLKESLENTKKFLAESVDLRAFVNELGVPWVGATRRIEGLGLQIFSLAGVKYLPKESAAILKSHFENYFCTAMAKSYLGVGSDSINNWRKFGGLDCLQSGDPGYVDRLYLYSKETVVTFPQRAPLQLQRGRKRAACAA